MKQSSAVSCALVCLLLALPGCKKEEQPANDGGLSGDAIKDAGHNQDELTLTGTVTLKWGSPATGVTVTARCGPKKTYTATTDDKGGYSVTANVKGCSALVVEFNKESYLPNLRVIHLPHPTSPMTLNVPLSELGKLQCGTYSCTVENDTRWLLPNDPMKQGWVIGMSGKAGLDYLAGEFIQKDGKLVSMLGFTYLDFRDKGGAKIETLKDTPTKKERFELCSPVPWSALDWYGDVKQGTDEVELTWFTLDKTTGRWTPFSKYAYAKYTKGYKQKKNSSGFCEQIKDKDGQPIKNIVHIKRKDLGNIRAQKFTFVDECMGGQPIQVSEYWVCGEITGSGWFAQGVAVPGKTCIELTAKDQCGRAMPNVVFQVKGRDHGYRATTWTNPQGKACLEALPSEPVGKDYDFDSLGGETFYVRVDFTYGGYSQSSIEDHKLLKFDFSNKGSCTDTSKCDKLSPKFTDFSKPCK